jgi:hypothetical protein
MKKMKLNSFETYFHGSFVETRLTYETPIGVAKITVNSNDKAMSTGGFHFSSFSVDNVTDKEFAETDVIVRNEAVEFVDNLRGFLYLVS